jgi:hypothetical protein
MTPLPVSIAAAVASFLLLLVVFELIRSRRLRERYALLWLLTGAVCSPVDLAAVSTIAGWSGVGSRHPGAVGAHPRIVLLHSDRDPRLDQNNFALAGSLPAQLRRDYGTVTVTGGSAWTSLRPGRQPVGRLADAVRPRPRAGLIFVRAALRCRDRLRVEPALVGCPCSGAGRIGRALRAQHPEEDICRPWLRRVPRQAHGAVRSICLEPDV